MPRRPTRHASRAIGASAVPTPVQSAHTTPLSSAYPSTYTSEVENDGEEDDARMISISTLTLRDLPPTETQSLAARRKLAKRQPFPFMDLPSELRVKIYGFHFAGVAQVIDLDPDNYKRIHRPLAILRVCRRIYAEASHYFYGTHTARVFPTHPGRFFKTKKPLLSRLTHQQRTYLTSLELRLGPGWNKPPRGWVVNSSLGLADCVKVRRLTVFVECDPSDGVFNGFRRADGFYETFSRNLLGDVLIALPHVDKVYFDAWTSVKKDGAMMKALFQAALAHGRKICWGPERGWSDREETEVATFEYVTLDTRASLDVLVVA